MNRNWIIGVAVAGGAYLVNSVMQVDRDETGAIVAEGSLDAFQMHVGDAVFDVTAASFPGDAMAGMAHEGCLARFEAFVGRDYDSSSLDIATLYPSHDTWHGQNDREVICAVYDIDAKKLTGSVKGSAL